MNTIVDILESGLMAEDSSEVEFFGIRIKVKDPRLAALLNSNVTEDVVVVAQRAKDVFDEETEQPAEADSAGAAEPAGE
jgi:hypothetical protein